MGAEGTLVKGAKHLNGSTCRRTKPAPGSSGLAIVTSGGLQRRARPGRRILENGQREASLVPVHR
eukprot:188202-Pyramimonas_sp.AAC.1